MTLGESLDGDISPIRVTLRSSEIPPKKVATVHKLVSVSNLQQLELIVGSLMALIRFSRCDEVEYIKTVDGQWRIISC